MNYRTEKDGFTLIELLVVIAIISLLVSILLPSLQKAKDLANNVVCASNLKGIGLSLAMYDQEYDGQRPPFTDASQLPHTSNGLGLVRGLNAQTFGLGLLLDREVGTDDFQGGMYLDNLDALFCPADGGEVSATRKNGTGAALLPHVDPSNPAYSHLYAGYMYIYWEEKYITTYYPTMAIGTYTSLNPTMCNPANMVLMDPQHFNYAVSSAYIIQNWWHPNEGRNVLRLDGGVFHFTEQDFADRWGMSNSWVTFFRRARELD